MKIDLKRYELFGWDYEYINPLTDKEVAWYLKFAKETEYPILELACGTARLLVSIAKAGFEIDGIDLCKNMLTIARKRISQLSPEIQARIRIHNIDMSNFQLGRKFGLIFIADNSFRELTTKKQHLSCLKSIYNHLRPNGKFLMTEHRFNSLKFVNGKREIPWSKPFRNTVTGDMVQRRIEIKLTENGKWISGVMFYKTIHADGNEIIDECPWYNPLLLKDNYISLFSEAGFSTKVFVGYEEKKDDGKDPFLCFVCNKNE
jgi:SAM-dependent methyltransferase